MTGHRPPDALAAAIAWLRAHPDLPDQLTQGNKPQVSSADSGKYPCLRLRYRPGGRGGTRWNVETELQVDLLDHPDKRLRVASDDALELLQTCVWLLAELPDADQPIPGRHEVVSSVESSVSPALVPDPGAPDQPLWTALVIVNAHPAPVAPT